MSDSGAGYCNTLGSVEIWGSVLLFNCFFFYIFKFVRVFDVKYNIIYNIIDDIVLIECAIKSLSEICNDTNQLDKHISSAKAFAIKMKSTIENEYSLEELILTHLLKLISHFTEKNLLKCWIH